MEMILEETPPDTAPSTSLLTPSVPSTSGTCLTNHQVITVFILKMLWKKGTCADVL